MSSITNIESKYDYDPTHSGKLFADEWNLVVNNLKSIINESNGDYTADGVKELVYAIGELRGKLLFTAAGANNMVLSNKYGNTVSQYMEASGSVFFIQPTSNNTGNVTVKFSGSGTSKRLLNNGSEIAPGVLHQGTIYLIEHDFNNNVYRLVTLYAGETSGSLLTDGSKDMDVGYVPLNNLSVITKQYFEAHSGGSGSGSAGLTRLRRIEVTAGVDQDTFDLDYEPGLLVVTARGYTLYPSDWTENTEGTQVVFDTPFKENDELMFTTYGVFEDESYLKTDGSRDMDDGYVPLNDMSVITLKYFEDNNGGGGGAPVGETTNVIKQPEILTPIEGPTNFDGPITSSSFRASNGYVISHDSTDWEIATDEAFTNIVFSKYRTAFDLTKLELEGVTAGTENFVRCRYNADNYQSEWSDVESFTTTLQGIATPFITLRDTLQFYQNVVIIGSAFNIIGATETHLSTDWEIATDEAFANIVYQSLDDESNLTYLNLTSELDMNTNYFVRCRYKSTSYVSSYTNKTFRTVQYIIDDLQLGELLIDDYTVDKNVTVNNANSFTGTLNMTTTLGSTNITNDNFVWTIPVIEGTKIVYLKLFITDTVSGDQISTFLHISIPVKHVDIIGNEDIHLLDDSYIYASDTKYKSQKYRDLTELGNSFNSYKVKINTNIVRIESIDNLVYNVLIAPTIEDKSTGALIVKEGDNFNTSAITSTTYNDVFIETIKGKGYLGVETSYSFHRSFKFNDDLNIFLYAESTSDYEGRFKFIDNYGNVVSTPIPFNMGVTKNAFFLKSLDGYNMIYFIDSNDYVKFINITDTGEVLNENYCIATAITGTTLSVSEYDDRIYVFAGDKYCLMSQTNYIPGNASGISGTGVVTIATKNRNKPNVESIVYADRRDSNGYGRVRGVGVDTFNNYFNEANTSLINIDGLYNGRFILTYKDDDDSGRGKFAVFNKDGSTNLSEQTFSNDTMVEINTTLLRNENLIVFYRKSVSSKMFYCVIDINNGAFVIGETQYLTNDIYELNISTMLDKLFISYKDDTDSKLYYEVDQVFQRVGLELDSSVYDELYLLPEKMYASMNKKDYNLLPYDMNNVTRVDNTHISVETLQDVNDLDCDVWINGENLGVLTGVSAVNSSDGIVSEDVSYIFTNDYKLLAIKQLINGNIAIAYGLLDGSTIIDYHFRVMDRNYNFISREITLEVHDGLKNDHHTSSNVMSVEFGDGRIYIDGIIIDNDYENVLYHNIHSSVHGCSEMPNGNIIVATSAYEYAVIDSDGNDVLTGTISGYHTLYHYDAVDNNIVVSKYVTTGDEYHLITFQISDGSILSNVTYQPSSSMLTTIINNTLAFNGRFYDLSDLSIISGSSTYVTGNMSKTSDNNFLHISNAGTFKVYDTDGVVIDTGIIDTVKDYYTGNAIIAEETGSTNNGVALLIDNNLIIKTSYNSIDKKTITFTTPHVLPSTITNAYFISIPEYDISNVSKITQDIKKLNIEFNEVTDAGSSFELDYVNSELLDFVDIEFKK